MKQIKIQAITSKGEEAIRQHLREFKKMGVRDRLIFKTAGYKQEILLEDPLTLLLTINNKHSNNSTFVGLIYGEIEKAMIKNGAAKEDYFIEVVREIKEEK